MGLLTNLFRLTGPTLPAGYCPTSFQQLADDFFNGSQVTFLIDTGSSFFNYGSATPAPENRIFPWLNTDDGLWWNFKFGLWVAPVSPRDTVDGFRQMYRPPQGTLQSVVWTLDSGDGTDGQPTLPDNSPNPGYVAPTQTTGAMWIVDYQLNGRFPLGVGIIPNSDLGAGDAQVGVSQTGDSFGREGEYAHKLIADEMRAHWHGVGTDGVVGGNDPPIMISRAWNVAPTNLTQRLQDSPGAGTWGDGPLFSAGTMGSTNPMTDVVNLSDGHQNMPPFIGVWWLQHTARRYYTRPA